MRIKLVSYTPHPDQVAGAVGRLSREHGMASEVLDRYMQNPDEAARTLRAVLRMGHQSVAEHAYFEIAFDQVPMSVEWFMIQFRLGSYLVKSRRYVDFRDVGAFTPVLFEQKMGLMEEYKQFVEQMFDSYSRLVDIGVPIYGRSFVEDARFVLPYSFNTSFFCGMNARELAYCLNQALHGRGSRVPEIRQAGEMILEQLREIAPTLFSLSTLDKTDDRKSEDLQALVGSDLDRQTNYPCLVELWESTQHPDNEIAIAALFNETLASREAISNWLATDERRVGRVLSILLANPRQRELEQIVFRFRINRVSWSALTHFARHRMYSPLFPDLTKMCDNKSYIIPETIRKVPALSETYEDAWLRAQAFRKTLTESDAHPTEMVLGSLSGNLADFVASFNGRELHHFFRLRCCENSQYEIRDRADRMLSLVLEKSPLAFRTAGPACYALGRCTEGRNTCGQPSRIKDKYERLQRLETGSG